MEVKFKVKAGHSVNHFAILNKVYEALNGEFEAVLRVKYSNKRFKVMAKIGDVMDEFEGADLSEVIRKAVEFAEDMAIKLALAE
jgi:hypothetical protein